ncbi:MAG: hypothetical protein EZS28_022204, partial [Streblomastix strix]
ILPALQNELDEEKQEQDRLDNLKKQLEDQRKKEDEKKKDDEKKKKAEQDKKRKAEEPQFVKGVVKVDVGQLRSYLPPPKDGQTDPYVVLVLGPEKRKTKDIKNQPKPNFNEKFDIPFDPEQTKDRDLVVEVWDKNKDDDDDDDGVDKLVGQAVVPILPFLENFSDANPELHGIDENKDQPTGKIKLNVVYEHDPFVNDRELQGINEVISDDSEDTHDSEIEDEERQIDDDLDQIDNEVNNLVSDDEDDTSSSSLSSSEDEEDTTSDDDDQDQSDYIKPKRKGKGKDKDKAKKPTEKQKQEKKQRDLEAKLKQIEKENEKRKGVKLPPSSEQKPKTSQFVPKSARNPPLRKKEAKDKKDQEAFDRAYPQVNRPKEKEQQKENIEKPVKLNKKDEKDPKKQEQLKENTEKPQKFNKKDEKDPKIEEIIEPAFFLEETKIPGILMIVPNVKYFNKQHQNEIAKKMQIPPQYSTQTPQTLKQQSFQQQTPDKIKPSVIVTPQAVQQQQISPKSTTVPSKLAQTQPKQQQQLQPSPPFNRLKFADPEFQQALQQLQVQLSDIFLPNIIVKKNAFSIQIPPEIFKSSRFSPFHKYQVRNAMSSTRYSVPADQKMADSYQKAVTQRQAPRRYRDIGKQGINLQSPYLRTTQPAQYSQPNQFYSPMSGQTAPGQAKLVQTEYPRYSKNQFGNPNTNTPQRSVSPALPQNIRKSKSPNLRNSQSSNIRSSKSPSRGSSPTRQTATERLHDLILATKLEHSVSIAIEPAISVFGQIQENYAKSGVTIGWEAGKGEINKKHAIWKFEVKFNGNEMERGIGIMSGKDLPYPPFDNLQDRVAWYRGNNGALHLRGAEFDGGEPWGSGDVVTIEVDMGNYDMNEKEYREMEASEKQDLELKKIKKKEKEQKQSQWKKSHKAKIVPNDQKKNKDNNKQKDKHSPIKENIQKLDDQGKIVRFKSTKEQHEYQKWQKDQQKQKMRERDRKKQENKYDQKLEELKEQRKNKNVEERRKAYFYVNGNKQKFCIINIPRTVRFMLCLGGSGCQLEVLKMEQVLKSDIDFINEKAEKIVNDFEEKEKEALELVEIETRQLNDQEQEIIALLKKEVEEQRKIQKEKEKEDNEFRIQKRKKEIQREKKKQKEKREQERQKRRYERAQRNKDRRERRERLKEKQKMIEDKLKSKEDIGGDGIIRAVDLEKDKEKEIKKERERKRRQRKQDKYVQRQKDKEEQKKALEKQNEKYKEQLKEDDEKYKKYQQQKRRRHEQEYKQWMKQERQRRNNIVREQSQQFLSNSLAQISPMISQQMKQAIALPATQPSSLSMQLSPSEQYGSQFQQGNERTFDDIYSAPVSLTYSPSPSKPEKSNSPKPLYSNQQKKPADNQQKYSLSEYILKNDNKEGQELPASMTLPLTLSIQFPSYPVIDHDQRVQQEIARQMKAVHKWTRYIDWGQQIEVPSQNYKIIKNVDLEIEQTEDKLEKVKEEIVYLNRQVQQIDEANQIAQQQLRKSNKLNSSQKLRKSEDRKSSNNNTNDTSVNSPDLESSSGQKSPMQFRDKQRKEIEMRLSQLYKQEQTLLNRKAQLVQLKDKKRDGEKEMIDDELSGI